MYILRTFLVSLLLACFLLLLFETGGGGGGVFCLFVFVFVFMLALFSLAGFGYVVIVVAVVDGDFSTSHCLVENNCLRSYSLFAFQRRAILIPEKSKLVFFLPRVTKHGQARALIEVFWFNVH